MKDFKQQLTLIALLLLGTVVSAQNNSISWQATFGGTDNESINHAQATTDGGSILMGTTNSNDGTITTTRGGTDIWILKLDAQGNLQWQRNFGGSGEEQAGTLRSTTDGGYLFVGTTPSNDGDITTPKGLNDVWVVKLDGQGNLQWQKTFGGSLNDFGVTLQTTADGGSIVGGHTTSSNGDVTGNRQLIDIWILKLDAQGNLQWQKTFGGEGFDALNALVVSPDGGYLGLGSSNSQGGHISTNHGSTDAWLFKLDSQGNLQWQKNLGGTAIDALFDLKLSAHGGYILTGYSSSSNGDLLGNRGGEDVWVVKLDLQGHLEWQTTFGSGRTDLGTCIENTADGGYILTGYSNSNEGLFFRNYGDFDIWILKLDALGNLQWHRNYGGSATDGVSTIYQTSNTNYKLAGGTHSIDYDRSNSRGNSDAWIFEVTNPQYYISGFVYNDLNNDCASTGTPSPMKQRLIQAKHTSNSNYDAYAYTDLDGNYQIYTWATGNYQINVVLPWFLQYPTCFSVPTVTLNSSQSIATGVDFPIHIRSNCPSLEVSNTCSYLERCSDNTYYVRYANKGLGIAYPSYVDIQLDSTMTLLNSSIPHIALGNKVYRFHLGAVTGESEGNFSYSVYLACGDSTVLGQSHCVATHIYPDSVCLPTPQSANIRVESNCLGDSIDFIIRNIGTATSPALRYHVFEDEVLEYQGITPSIPINQFVRVRRPTNQQSTYRLEISNPINNLPYSRLWGTETPSSTIEGCGAVNFFNTGIVSQFSTPDDQPWLDIDCQTSVPSQQTLSKEGYPLGLGTSHFITSNEPIKYKIRFQNRGTDSVRYVRILDTLDTDLDPSTIEYGASSHPYQVQIFGNGILQIIVAPIALPRDSVDAIGSQGFVTFKIWPKANRPLGTELKNTAFIDFYVSDPVASDTTNHSVDNTDRVTLSIKEDAYLSSTPLSVFPNPFEHSATLTIGEQDLDHFQLYIYNTLGEKVESYSYFNTHKAIIYRNQLPKGTYFYRIEHQHKMINTGQLSIY